MNDLTSNPNTTKLEETEVMGRTVYVSRSSEKAYVEYRDELVSMTNLKAWYALMEKAKKDVIEDYDGKESFEEKQLEKKRDNIAEKINDMARELQREADRLHRRGEL